MVRHFIERHKVSNSARLIPLALESARIVDVGAAGISPPDADAYAAPGTFLLFPGGRALQEPLSSRVERLVVPDGSWSQVRRMRTRVASLAALPSVTVIDDRDSLRLRQPRWHGELPTAIAVARALDACGDARAATLLEQTFDDLHAVLTSPMRRR